MDTHLPAARTLLALDIDGTLLLPQDREHIGRAHRHAGKAFYQTETGGESAEKMVRFIDGLNMKTTQSLPMAGFWPLRKMFWKALFQNIASRQREYAHIDVFVISQSHYHAGDMGKTLDLLYETPGFFETQVTFLTKARPGQPGTMKKDIVAIAKDEGTSGGMTMEAGKPRIVKSGILTSWLTIIGHYSRYALVDDTPRHIAAVQHPNKGFDPTSATFETDLNYFLAHDSVGAPAFAPPPPPSSPPPKPKPKPLHPKPSPSSLRPPPVVAPKTTKPRPPTPPPKPKTGGQAGPSVKKLASQLKIPIAAPSPSSKGSPGSSGGKKRPPGAFSYS